MHAIHFLLALIALVLFGAAALGASYRQVNLLAAGLAVFTLSIVLQLAQEL